MHNENNCSTVWNVVKNGFWIVWSETRSAVSVRLIPVKKGRGDSLTTEVQPGRWDVLQLQMLRTWHIRVWVISQAKNKSRTEEKKQQFEISSVNEMSQWSTCVVWVQTRWPVGQKTVNLHQDNAGEFRVRNVQVTHGPGPIRLTAQERRRGWCALPRCAQCWDKYYFWSLNSDTILPLEKSITLVSDVECTTFAQHFFVCLEIERLSVSSYNSNDDNKKKHRTICWDKTQGANSISEGPWMKQAAPMSSACCQKPWDYHPSNWNLAHLSAEFN